MIIYPMLQISAKYKILYFIYSSNTPLRQVLMSSFYRWGNWAEIHTANNNRAKIYTGPPSQPAPNLECHQTLGRKPWTSRRHRVGRDSRRFCSAERYKCSRNKQTRMFYFHWCVVGWMQRSKWKRGKNWNISTFTNTSFYKSKVILFSLEAKMHNA